MSTIKTPFPFSVGFPLVIREQSESLAICGANRGEGWPILCLVPKDTHHEKDALSIVAACTDYIQQPANNSSLSDALYKHSGDLLMLAKALREREIDMTAAHVEKIAGKIYDLAEKAASSTA